MSKYFTDKGYFRMGACFEDTDYDFIFVVSARGPGKTWGALEWLANNSSEDNRFLHVRRLAKEVDMMRIENVYAEYEVDLRVEKIDKIDTVIRGESEVVGYHLPLNNIKGVRGVPLKIVKNIFYDEFIPELGSYRRQYEGYTMLNAYESVNRNRELDGYKPVKMVCAANLNEPYSELLAAFGFTDELETLSSAYPIGVKTIKNKKLIMINDTKIIEQKRQTALYQAAADQTFLSMALDNSNTMEYMPVKHYGRGAYDYQGTIGMVNINRLKNGGGYYITKASKPGGQSRRDILKWARVYNAYVNGRLLASSNYVAKVFLDIYEG